MKISLKLALLTGVTLPLIGSAQVIVSGPDTSPTQNLVDNSSFHNLVVAMQSDEGDLRTTEGESLSVTSPIYFNYNVNPTSPLTFSNVDWHKDTSTGGSSTIKFVLIPNFPAFNMKAGGQLDVGFIGEESRNNNELGFYDGAGPYQKLFDYNAGGQNPPMSYQLTATNATTITFQHKNLTTPTGTGFQANPLRFRIYQAVADGKATGEYLFATADRDGTKDADYDDGFFYISGDISPVPEPAQIAGLAVLGLGALLYIRRRIRK